MIAILAILVGAALIIPWAMRLYSIYMEWVYQRTGGDRW